ncbi:potassium-transporting ATPase subunit KdpC [Pseudooceanicola sp. CBS1P-1]|uniref:Potassium-transporting ATPase KdpC subunit n=1 Tax=Pseudooceanicola albus TaxID=2692189 RepID=A0A6L7G1N3_9RHOB|nr:MULTISPECIES: potassium-transporting ATPase subunit KdpC [Pseudooceanicola]MBT9383524.1 potassium-transporting ATPase subunit KdpC [Pseudooceanicola endophyticus]MXN17380.1 potassium-transporting ATPase subunit KdpC [Pseudooceanicola albus]
MLVHFRPALVLLLALSLLTGLAYPLAVTGVAGLIWPAQAAGSLVRQGDRIVGSALIAQGEDRPAYLHPRPSAVDWNASASGASNLGPTSRDLAGQVADRRAAYQAQNGVAAPGDAVTASGSGLDPDISLANALAQAPRIARARGIAPEKVRTLIMDRVHRPWLGLYGVPYVTVLTTNLALDEAFPAQPSGTR